MLLTHPASSYFSRVQEERLGKSSKPPPTGLFQQKKRLRDEDKTSKAIDLAMTSEGGQNLFGLKGVGWGGGW